MREDPSLSDPSPSLPAYPATNGLWFCRDPDDKSTYWLRFYPDGVVIEVTALSGPPELTSAWLRLENPRRPFQAGRLEPWEGGWRWVVSSAQEAASERGVVFTARWEGEVLWAEIFSRATLFSSHRAYRFTPLEERFLTNPPPTKAFQSLRRWSQLPAMGLTPDEATLLRRHLTLIQVSSWAPEELVAVLGQPLAEKVVAWRRRER